MCVALYVELKKKKGVTPPWKNVDEFGLSFYYKYRGRSKHVRYLSDMCNDEYKVILSCVLEIEHVTSDEENKPKKKIEILLSREIIVICNE